MNNFWTSLGLNKSQYLTYKALLSTEQNSVRQISEKTGINRGTTHEILRQLLKKGLVSFQLKGKRKHYLAESPEKLNLLLSQKATQIKKTKELLDQEIIPQLKTHHFISEKPVAQYYEGDEGIEKVLKDVLRTMKKQEKKEYFVFSAKALRKYLYRFFPSFTKQRIKNKIKVKVIALGQGGEEASLAQRKWLKSNNHASASYIIIYTKKLALISLTVDELPYAVVIQEESISQTMKLIFDALWQLL